jgi:hypothetical protein
MKNIVTKGNFRQIFDVFINTEKMILLKRIAEIS